MAKILLVEDEGSLMALYTELLEGEHHEVIQAADGETGLNLAETTEWDIMFLDIMLPGMDGLSVLKKLSEKQLLNGRPIIVLSNLDNPSIVDECLRHGAKEHLNKSKMSPEIVLNLVQKYTETEKP